MSRWRVMAILMALGAGGGSASQPVFTWQEPQTAALTGIVYDPNGRPAENLLLTLIGRESDVSLNVRSDAAGRFQVTPIAPGPYLLRTPVTVLLSPALLELKNGANTVEAHMALDDTAVLIRVCRECKPAEYRLPEAIKHEFTDQRDEMSAAILRRAEPEEGWDAFNERPFPYPAAMKTSKLEGSVEIEGTIAVDGASTSLEVVSSTDARLTDAAMQLAQQLRWHPARLRSTPVEVPLRVTVDFSLYLD